MIATVEKVWANDIRNSKALKDYASSRGAQFAPASGADAMKAVMPAVQVNAWQAFDGGKAKVSPDTLGIAGRRRRRAPCPLPRRCAAPLRHANTVVSGTRA